MDHVTPDLLKITKYELLDKLPDPFLFEDGHRVSSPDEWEARRAEIYKSAIELQYGTIAPDPEFLEIEATYLGGRGQVSSYRITTGTRENPVSFRMQLYLPSRHVFDYENGKLPPVIVDGDLCFGTGPKPYYEKNPPHTQGIALAVFDRTELAHDVRGEGRRKGQLYQTYPEYTFGALGAWAWGYSRVVDALEILGLTDPDMIIFTGHSRGAKTAALAGALDRRAAIVNPNATCAGACGCYRLHIEASYKGGAVKRSETLADLWANFPFWVGEGMEDYTEQEAALPFDAHMLKAMIAPRTLFISEAAGDIWSNPVGSWQTTRAAGEVFDFLGASDNLFWYFRPGDHCHTATDMQMLINLIKHKTEGAPLDEKFFTLPFEPFEPIYDWKAPKAKHS